MKLQKPHTLLPKGYPLLVYLWGIETSDITKRARERIIVISLPMRNWNYYISAKWTIQIQVISLPMRNWNFSSGWHVFSDSIVISLPMRNWNAYAFSMRNWPGPVISLPMRNWNPYGGRRLYSRLHVISLPMRNWNLKTSRENRGFFQLLVYLWGIETVYC